jgi:hypothetical protein
MGAVAAITYRWLAKMISLSQATMDHRVTLCSLCIDDKHLDTPRSKKPFKLLPVRCFVCACCKSTQELPENNGTDPNRWCIANDLDRFRYAWLTSNIGICVQQQVSYCPSFSSTCSTSAMASRNSSVCSFVHVPTNSSRSWNGAVCETAMPLRTSSSATVSMLKPRRCASLRIQDIVISSTSGIDKDALTGICLPHG